MDNPLGPAAGTARRRVVYVGATVLVLALPQVRGMLPVFRDALQSYFDISIDQFGLLLSVGAIPGALAGAVGGRLVDRCGPRAVLRVCLFGAAGALAAAGAATRWGMMLVALGFLALFAAPLYIAAQAHLVRLFPSRRRRVLSIGLAALSGGGIVFPLLAEWLLGVWRASPSISFGHILHTPLLAVALVLAAGALLYGRNARPAESPDAPAAAAAPARARGALLLVGLIVIHGMCDTSAHVWMARVLDSASFARQAFAPGAVVAAFSLAYLVSRAILSLLPERWGARVLMVAPGLVGGTMFLAGVLSRSQAWTSVGYVAGAFCWSLEAPVILAALASGGSRRFGTTLGVVAVAAGIMTFLMTNAMGVIARSAGDASLWVILLLPAAGFPLVGLGGALWVWRFGRRVEGPEGSPSSQAA